jgi:poly(A) polymerase
VYRVSTKSNLNFEDCSPGLDTLPPEISPPEISNVRLVGIEEILGLEALDIAIETAEQTQTPCYLVGGVLRDALLHRPVKDIDLLVLGSGPDFAEAWAANLPGRPKVHAFKNFGTAMVHHNGLQFEVVGARKESYDRDSRKPVVSTGTLEDDLARRDFSINALAFELYPQYGRWIDNYNGIRDLEARRLVTPLEPTLTFSDDPLRMLRAARFAAQLGFELDPETLQAMGREAERIRIVSMERITDEFNKILLSQRPAKGLGLLFDAGILALIFPELTRMQGVKVINGQGHKDNFYHTLQVVENLVLRSEDLWLRWAALLHDIAKPQTQKFDPEHGWTFHGHEELGARMVPRIFRHFKLPLDHTMQKVQNLVRLHLRPIALTKNKVSDSAMRRLLFEVGEDIDDLMELCRADITSKNEAKVQRYLRNFEDLDQRLKAVSEADRMRLWQPPLGGAEIMACFGLEPGRQVGVIKNRIRQAILDGEIENNQEQAYDLMLRIGQEIGLQPRPRTSEISTEQGLD